MNHEELDMFGTIPFTSEDELKVTGRTLPVYFEATSDGFIFHTDRGCEGFHDEPKAGWRYISVRDLSRKGAACGECFYETDEGFELGSLLLAVEELYLRVPSNVPPKLPLFDVAKELVHVVRLLHEELIAVDEIDNLPGTLQNVDRLLKERFKVLNNFLASREGISAVGRFFTLVSSAAGLNQSLSLSPKDPDAVLSDGEHFPYGDPKNMHSFLFNEWLHTFALKGSREDAFESTWVKFKEHVGSTPILLSDLPKTFPYPILPGESSKDYLTKIWVDALKETFTKLEEFWFNEYQKTVRKVDLQDTTFLLVDLNKSSSKIIEVAVGCWRVATVPNVGVSGAMVHVLRVPTIFAEGLYEKSTPDSILGVMARIKSEASDTEAVLETAVVLWDAPASSWNKNNGGPLTAFDGALNAARAACAPSSRV